PYIGTDPRQIAAFQAPGDLLQQRPELLAELLEVSRQPVDQGEDLTVHHRRQPQQDRQKNKEEGGGDDDGRQGPRQAPPLQPIADRIKQIGSSHAGDERRQNVSQDIEQPEQNDEEGKGPQSH